MYLESLHNGFEVSGEIEVFSNHSSSPPFGSEDPPTRNETKMDARLKMSGLTDFFRHTRRL